MTLLTILGGAGAAAGPSTPAGVGNVPVILAARIRGIQAQPTDTQTGEPNRDMSGDNTETIEGEPNRNIHG